VITIELNVSGTDAKASAALAMDLQSFLKRYVAAEASTAEIARLANEGHQDTGTVLQIVLAAPAIVVLAHGLAGWMTRQPKASISLKKTGDLEVRNISGHDAIKIIKMMQGNDSEPS
jgi:hypothetical protein